MSCTSMELPYSKVKRDCEECLELIDEHRNKSWQERYERALKPRWFGLGAFKGSFKEYKKRCYVNGDIGASMLYWAAANQAQNLLQFLKNHPTAKTITVAMSDFNEVRNALEKLA